MSVLCSMLLSVYVWGSMLSLCFMIKRVVICLVCNHVAEEDRGLIDWRIAILLLCFCSLV